MSLDYRKAKHGGTEKEILAHAIAFSVARKAKSKALSNRKDTKFEGEKGKDGYYRGHITAPSGKKFEITKPTVKGHKKEMLMQKKRGSRE